MKEFLKRDYESIYDALEACDNNQHWNVVSIYPTGWRQEVCVVYYITKQNKVMKAAELIVQKEYPESPVIPPFNPVVPYPWTTPPTPREPIMVMYGVVPTQFEVQGDATTSASISTKKEED